MFYEDNYGYKTTNEQEKFFKDSQMRTDEGELRPYYHYTVSHFNEFDISTLGKQSGDKGYFGIGFYFTGQESFNSCCWPDRENGEELIKLECYLNLKNPFAFDKLGKVSYNDENYHAYDKDNFLHYLKNYIEDEDLKKTIVRDEDEFIEFIKDNYHYDEYQELIEAYEDGDIDFYDEVDDKSLDRLYSNLERDTTIITPNNLEYGHIHRGMLCDFTEVITDYVKQNGFDGILSDSGSSLKGCTEVVVFYPEQIKSIHNLYPTNDKNMHNNAEDYLMKNSEKLTPEQKNEIEQFIAKYILIEVSDIEKDDNGNYSGIIHFEDTENKFSIINDNFNIDYKAPSNSKLINRYDEVKELVEFEIECYEKDMAKEISHSKNQFER